MSEEKEKYSLAELSEDAGLSWKNYLSKAIRKGLDVFARLKGQGTLTILDEIDSETKQATFMNLDMKNQLWGLPYSELEKLMIDMPPWHITSVVPPDIVQEDPNHFQFQFRGESINENDLFLLVPATDKTENKTTDKTEHQAIKKTGQRAGNELHKVFWRAFVAFREENNINPDYKQVWQMIYDDFQHYSESPYQERPNYDIKEIIVAIDPVNVPSPKLNWEIRQKGKSDTYDLKQSLPSLLSRLKKNPPLI
jgi:hypothetical protein